MKPLVPSVHRTTITARPGRRAGKALLPVLTTAAFLALWQGMAASGIYTPYQLPSPALVLSGLVELGRAGMLWPHIRISLYRFSVAYLLAAGGGVPLGLLLGWYAPLHRALDPLIQVLRPISPIAWFPLAVLWFKVGDPPAIFIIFLSVFFPVVLATVAAVRKIDPLYLKVAVNFGLRERDLLVKVVLPAAVPGIMVGLHIALGTGWIHLVAGEMLGAQSGLGFLIVDARNFLRTDLVISGMLVIGLLGLTLDRIMGLAERRVTGKWGGGFHG